MTFDFHNRYIHVLNCLKEFDVKIAIAKKFTAFCRKIIGD